MIPILDNGHGGMIAGKYQTKGKRSPKWKDGSQLFEGECNRAIKARVIEMLFFKGVPYYDLVPEQVDISLNERIERANKFHKDHNKKTFLISLHSDIGGGKGYGLGSFISKNASRMSKSMAIISVLPIPLHNQPIQGLELFLEANLQTWSRPSEKMQSFHPIDQALRMGCDALQEF